MFPVMVHHAATRPSRAQRPNHPLIREYIAAHRNAWSPHHVYNTTSMLNRWKLWLALRPDGAVEVTAATRADCSEYIAERLVEINPRNAKAVSPNTVRKSCYALDGFYAWLAAEGELPEPRPGRSANPMAGVKFPATRQPSPESTPHITEATYEALMATFDGRKLLDARNAAICSLMYRSGLRRSAVVRCDLERLDMDEGTLVYWNAKGKRWCTAGLAEETRKLLARYLRRRGDDDLAPLFLGTYETKALDGRMTTDAVGSMLDRRAELIGEPLPAHAFRRAMAINAKAEGRNDTTVQWMGGWADTRQVNRYQRNKQEALSLAEFRATDPTAARRSDTTRRRGLRAV
jgi:site-specific recombinase XerD